MSEPTFDEQIAELERLMAAATPPERLALLTGPYLTPDDELLIALRAFVRPLLDRLRERETLESTADGLRARNGELEAQLAEAVRQSGPQWEGLRKELAAERERAESAMMLVKWMHEIITREGHDHGTDPNYWHECAYKALKVERAALRQCGEALDLARPIVEEAGAEAAVRLAAIDSAYALPAVRAAMEG